MRFGETTLTAPTKKKPTPLSSTFQSWLRDIFTIKSFKFLPETKSNLEILGWLSPGTLGWVGGGDVVGPWRERLRLDPPFWRWKKRRPFGRHVWSPKLSDEPNDLFLGGVKVESVRKFGVTFICHFKSVLKNSPAILTRDAWNGSEDVILHNSAEFFLWLSRRSFWSLQM